jgi:glycosyltransferase involved in cell wall biosynthesis
MRLLILSARLGTGGTRRYALEVAPALARLGHDVILAAPDLRDAPPHGVEPRPLPSTRWASVRRLLDEAKPDAIRLITGAFPPDTRWGLPLALRAVPMVESLHVLPHRTAVGPARTAFYRLRAARRYRCVVLSPGMESAVRRLCPALHPALVGMRYGMEIPPPGVRTGAPGSGIRFLTVTRLEEKQKDVATLIRAFRAVLDGWDASPPPTLAIVGDGPDRAALEALSRSLGLTDAVRFEGWAANSIDRMRDADVFVLSTKHESFGRVNIEAAAVGLPVIATDESGGGCRESVADGVTGVLVPPGDVGALAEAMRRMATDAAWRASRGAAGPAHAARFSIDAHARETVRLLEAVIPHRPNRA